jgi:hypothetical protein
MGQTGATLYVCHFKSIDSWVGTNNLVFYSGYNVSTLFYSGYNVSTLFYSGYNVSTLFGNQQKRSLTYMKRCTHQTHYHFNNMSPVIMSFHSDT